jgi:hypothetical protein
MRTVGIVAMLAALGLLTAPGAQATHGKLTGPAYPGYISCSSNQITFLEKAFFRAYKQVDAADQLLDYIASRPAADRAELWSRDMDTWFVPSPRRFFGPYDAKRFKTVRVAVEEARLRFLGRGDAARRGGVERIKAIRCYEKKCASDASAYHAVLSYIVTCQKFWRGDEDARLADAANTLAHEVFHWLRVDTGLYVTDLHGGGTHKYYGMDDVTWLAENKPKYAILNNDSYSYFGQAVDDGRQPLFGGVLADRESTARGPLIKDMTLAELQSKIQLLGSPYMYLDDVETYLRDGQRRYTGLWRLGCEPHSSTLAPCAEKPGSVVTLPRKAFVADHTARRSTQDLVDVEVYHEHGDWVFLGVYRPRKAGAVGVRGIQSKVSWDGLVEKDRQFRANAHLVDVETYLDGSKRWFTGVWVPGKLDTKLMRNNETAQFNTLKAQYDQTMQLVDQEAYKTVAIGLWNAVATRGRERTDWLRWDDFQAIVDGRTNRTLIDIEEYSTLPAQVLTSAPSGFAL